MVRVVICWMGVSGYLGACWRALAGRGDVELTVVSRHRTEGTTAFDVEEITRGLNCRVLGEPAVEQAELVSFVGQARPQVMIVSGWAVPAFRRLVYDPRFADVKKAMAIDTQWHGTLRQRAGAYVMRGYLNRMDRVLVPGERSFQFAKAMGVPESRILRAALGGDVAPLRGLHERRLALPGGWPRRFVYVGRYAEEKGLDLLVDAYRRYRAGVENPWPLACRGKGPLGRVLAGVEGIEDGGFVQPRDLANVLLHQGVFVLPSRYEPWGLVVAEAAGAGLPVLCTTACGAAVEIVRDYFNGLTVPTGDPEALARGMRYFHQAQDQLPTLGRQAIDFGSAFSAEVWAERIARMAHAVTGAA
jgi:glycosyltransferase involved in cell wall biosynthesis